MDFPISLPDLSFVSRDTCSLLPFCFSGTTSSTSLTLGFEFEALNEFDFKASKLGRRTDKHEGQTKKGSHVSNNVKCALLC